MRQTHPGNARKWPGTLLGIPRFRPRRAALILAALAIAITIAGFAGVLTKPAPAQAAETTLWSATMTVGKHFEADRFGFLAGSYGSLSDGSVTIDEAPYSVQRVIDNREHNRLEFRLAPNLSTALKQLLVLNVGDKSFDISSSSLISSTHSWTTTSLGWALGEEVAVSLKATIPNKPASFSATAGPGKVDLTWTNPNDATIAKYQYRQSADGGSSWSPDWKDISGSGATTVAHTVTGLASNTAYTFQIRAANVASHGAATGSVTATPSPAKPVGFTAEAGDGQVTLSWTKASDASITGYQVKQGTDWAGITDSGPTTVEHTVTGLSNGTAYTFQIRAMQGAVEGAESDPVTATPVAAAAQPTGLAATANHLGATLTWTDPSDSTITAYQFRQSADGGTTWNPDWAEITGSTGTTVEHTVTG